MFVKIVVNCWHNLHLGLEVAVLVNNVGLSYAFPAPFLEIEGGTNEVAADLVKCNITSVNTLTGLVLPQVRIQQLMVTVSDNSTRL